MALLQPGAQGPPANADVSWVLLGRALVFHSDTAEDPQCQWPMGAGEPLHPVHISPAKPLFEGCPHPLGCIL